MFKFKQFLCAEHYFCILIEQLRMRIGVRTWIKRAGIICLIPVLLVLLTVVLLYIPAVQNFAVKKITQSIAETTGMQVDIGSVHLSFPLHLKVTDITVIQVGQDTLLRAADLTLSVRLRPLLERIISVPAIQLSDVHFDSKLLIDGMEVSGYIGHLQVVADRIHLTNEEALLNELVLADSHIKLRIDSIASSDTTKSSPSWKMLLEKVQLDHIAFDLQMPSDSVSVMSYIEKAVLAGGNVDLGIQQYSASRFSMLNSRANYDFGLQPTKEGLDPSHIALSDIQIELDSLFWQEKDIHALIRQFSVKERSGLSIASMTGKMISDENTLMVSDWLLQTPYSKIAAQATVPWKALEKTPQGSILTQIAASLDRRDILIVAGESAESVRRFYPDANLTLSGLLEGNLDKIHIRQLDSEMPGVFKIDMHGSIGNVTDQTARSGDLYLTAQTQDESHFRRILLDESNGRYSLPDHLSMTLQASLEKGVYHVDMLLSESVGTMALSGHYQPDRQEYEMDLKVDSLALIHFLPQDSVFRVTAVLNAQGKGTDFFADPTWTQFNGALTQLLYKDISISDILLNGSFKDHQLQADLTSNYPYAEAHLTVDGTITKEKISGMFILDMDSLDLYGLQLAERPFSNSFQLFSELETDLDKRHLIDITLGNWEMDFGGQRVKPKALTLHAKGTEDTTYVSFHAGDLGINLTGNTDLKTMLDQLNGVSNDFMRQLKEDSTVNLQGLRPLLPEMRLQIDAKRENPVYNYLQMNSIFFDHFGLTATTSPEKGVNAGAFLHAFIKDTLKIDSMQLDLWQDSTKLNYAFDVVKNKFRKQEPFKAGLKGSLQYGLGDVEAYYLNEQGKTGLHLGARVEKLSEGMKICFFPENPVIAFLPFKMNRDNYVLIRDKNDISANLRMDGEGYASLWAHSLEDEGRMQELSVEISQIDLNKLSAGFAMLPALEGNASLSLRYVPMENTFMMVADANVDDLAYQKSRIGELLLSGAYLPLDNDRHQMDMHLFHDRHEISALSAIYQMKSGAVDGKMDIHQMPLMILNPFLAGTASLRGVVGGTMAVTGTEKLPVLNGSIKMDTASVYITAAGSRLRLDEKEIKVTDSKISFDKYSIYSVGNNPFVIDGMVDIRNLSKGTADLRLTAKNMQLLDAGKNSESLVYGKLSVDLNSTVKGPLNALTMRGNIHLLGGTNMSYILRESPLTIQDRMAGLVTFSYFEDTIPRRIRLEGRQRRESREGVTSSVNSGMDLLMTVQIDPAVKFKADLDEDASNRIELQGGGNLSFQYTKQGDMLLNGRYTLSDGLIRYNMPVISNKTLKIKEGSYIGWDGDPMDPYLNLKATERMRAYVSPEGESSRRVNFDAGIDVKQRLEDLSLQFTLDAVDDIAMQNQLTAMGAEERSKRAVGMLLTGMYLSEDQTGRMKFNMGSALNSFLESEINNLTGDLLGDVDFSFGMETYDGTGGSRTDYSFRFSKRFYDDRLNVILGGVVSAGDVESQQNSFINDASLEYRLDKGGNRYAKLFYNRRYESLLEGEIARFGSGFIFRRKMRRLSDLFRFKSPGTTARDIEKQNDSVEK